MVDAPNFSILLTTRKQKLSFFVITSQNNLWNISNKVFSLGFDAICPVKSNLLVQRLNSEWAK